MPSSRLQHAISVTSGRDDVLKVDLSPMIDMVFLLLIFFLLNASLTKVKIDPSIQVPLAEHADRQEALLGRIVINIAHQQSQVIVRDESGEHTLETDADILSYLTKAYAQLNDQKAAQLHLRGERDLPFKHCRRIMKLATQVGIERVIFASTPH